MARVRFDHVYKRFKKAEVIHDLCLDVQDKEFLVLLGCAGTGKSLCLQMIAGLEEPTEGDIYIGERRVNAIAPKDRDVAMVCQDRALYPRKTVFENIAFDLKQRHIPKAEINKRVHEVASLLNLDSLKLLPRHLTGGQRYRVALGRAMVCHPQVFLLDEPLSNLDTRLRVFMRMELIKIHQRMQTTTIYATHDPDEAMAIGARIAVLSGPLPYNYKVERKGKIIQLGSPRELYEHPVNIDVAGFIGSPSMNFIRGARIFGDNNATYIVLEGIGRVLVPEQHAQHARAAADHNLTFGIRPAHLEDASIAGEEQKLQSVIDATVEGVEYRGHELMVYLITGGHYIAATLDPRSTVVAGNKVRLLVDNSQIHLFDSDRGVAIF